MPGDAENTRGSVHAIALEGTLYKLARRRGGWHEKYCVLYADSCELTYYEGHTIAAWGRIPLKECNSIKLQWLKSADVVSEDPTEFRVVQYVPKGATMARYAHTKAKEAEGALEEVAEYTFRAANPQARLLWQWKIRNLSSTQRSSSENYSA